MQKGISRILEAIYEAEFLDCSYGFRPRRNCHQVLNAVDKIIMRKPINYVIEADIKGYFDNVSHDWMMKFLQVRINDSSFLLLVRRFLKAGYFEAGNRRRQHKSFSRESFREYRKHYPLPKPRIAHNLYTLSPVE